MDEMEPESPVAVTITDTPVPETRERPSESVIRNEMNIVVWSLYSTGVRSTAEMFVACSASTVYALVGV